MHATYCIIPSFQVSFPFENSMDNHAKIRKKLIKKYKYKIVQQYQINYS